MNPKLEINDLAVKIQCEIDKAKILAEYIMEKDDVISTYYVPVYFINSVLEEAGNLSEKIERLTYALKN